jgi:hypothetical protein
MGRILHWLSALLALGALTSPRLAQAKAVSPACPDAALQPISLTLDGASLQLCTPFLPGGNFYLPGSEDTVQMAYAVDKAHPARQLSILAVPFGRRPVSENLPVVDAGISEETYRDLLNADRRQQNGNPQPGPHALLFGRDVQATVSTLDLAMGGLHVQRVRISEWVTIAGKRLWIVRASQPASDPASTLFTLPAQTGIGLALSSDSLDHPSTSAAFSASMQTGNLSPDNARSLEASADLPGPSWWKGVCDTDTYTIASTNVDHLSSYPLGAVYRGLVACGPRPWADKAPDVLVHFFSGAWGELEWECVELSMRFMYLAYGVVPYPANGNQVVWNYPGDKLDKIANGTPGMAPQPDDVLSYCSTCTYGHTSVVTASNVDGEGDGTITVIEQNNSSTGASTLTVTGWFVNGNSGPVSGWLHLHTSAPILPNKVYLPLIAR